jgi:hypothetical protein
MTEPQPGDVYERDGERLTYLGTITSPSYKIPAIKYCDSKGRIALAFVQEWRRWAEGARKVSE